MPETAPDPPGRSSGRAPGPAATVAVIGLLFGLLFTLLTPPFQAPDENLHFRRAYLISAGDRLDAGPGGARGAWLPASLETLVGQTLQGIPFMPGKKLAPGTIRRALAISLEPERRAFVPADQLTHYLPVIYLPQALAVGLGRAAGARPLVLLYLARLANLAACLALAVLAVAIAPCCRWLLAALALVPMAVFLRSSASPDGLTDAAGLLLAGALLAAGFAPEPRRRRGLALAVTAAAFLAVAKGAYFLLPLALLAVPLPPSEPARRRLVRATAVALVLLGAAVAWSTAHRGYESIRPGAPTQPTAQAAIVAAAPFRFAWIAVADYVVHAKIYAVGFVGNLGWLDTPIPKLALVAYGALLVTLALAGGIAGAGFRPPQRALLLGIAAGTLLLISLSQYLTWTAVGAAGVDGIQGRYFLPLAPLAALAFGSPAWSRRWAAELSSRRAAWTLAAVLFACEAAALVKMSVRYYG